MQMFRPRLTDHHGLYTSQNEIDFAIPFLGEDLPLSIDPFLLWNSPSLQYQSLHSLLLRSINTIGFTFNSGSEDKMVRLLVELSECDEIGLGFSASGKGKKISEKKALEVLRLFTDIPGLQKNGFTHFEAIQLLVDGFSTDRISDITGNLLKSFLIDYTIEQCNRNKIPLSEKKKVRVYNSKKNNLEIENLQLPWDDQTNRPILLVPKYWLRKGSWISQDDYATDFLPKDILESNLSNPKKGEILLFNRTNYGQIEKYLAIKERTAEKCKCDPIFTPLPLLSVKRRLKGIKSLPTGNKDKADKHFEDYACQILTTVLFPHLDFAKEQARTDSGAIIRDLIFYNNRTIDFLSDIYDEFQNKQVVFELKNVKKIEREHIFQLNRYLNEDLGKFGIIVTRNKIPKNILTNTIDLWSGQRRCIIFLTDEDLELMVNLYENKQRFPLEVIKRNYLEFKRKCPS